ncbi:MAG: helix-turn-helix domain-containing protein [Bacteroidota bacterium]
MGYPNAHSEQLLVPKLQKKLEANLNNEQFGVEELADAIGLSRSQLHRKLKSATGQSISQFIREYRLEKARKLLLQEDFSAAEVAYKVGFNSPSYFSKAFHDYFGYTPGEAHNPKYQEQQIVEKKPLSDISSKVLVSSFLLIILAVFTYFILYQESKEEEVNVENSIAVLPFKNLSPEEENQYFTDGMMEAILNHLSQLEEMRVISRTTAMKYKNTKKSLPEIAKELNVNYILEGSGQKYGKEIRITVQLIAASSDQHIWSQEYTRKFEYFFQLQNEIAKKVANELKAKLSIEDQLQLTKKPTKNTEAYNYYLKGLHQLRKYNEEGFINAAPLFEKAIALDSNFIEPYVSLAEVYQTGGLVWGLFDQLIAKQKSKKLLLKALEKDKDNPLIHNILQAYYFYFEWDFKKAQIHQELFKSLTGHYGDLAIDYSLKIGQFQRALNIADYFIENDPANSIYYFFKAEALYFLNKKQQAIAVMDSAYKLHSDFFFLREAIKLYYLYGETEKSYKALNKFKRIFPDRPPIFYWFELIHVKQSKKNPAPYIKILKSKYQENASGSPAWFMAMYHAINGNEDKIFEWLEKSFDHREVEMTWLKIEPLLKSYRNDPRYKDLYERMNFPEGIVESHKL